VAILESSILATNDDSIWSLGLLALKSARPTVQRVTVLGLQQNWASWGRVKTMRRPLRYNEVAMVDIVPALAADGNSPATGSPVQSRSVWKKRILTCELWQSDYRITTLVKLDPTGHGIYTQWKTGW